MKFVIILFLAWAFQADAASLAICTDSKADDGRTYFKVVWFIEVPSDKIKLTKTAREASDVTIIVGGQVQDFSPNVDITIEVGQDAVGTRIVEAMKTYPKGHLALIQNRSIVGMIMTDTKDPRSLVDHIETGVIRFHIPKWRIKSED